MFNKIRYRLVYNYSGKLNKEGKAPVALECRQGKKKMYISSGVHFVSAGQTGNPDSTSQWIIISHVIYSQSMGGSFGVQFAFAIDNAKAYYRMIWKTSREWKEL